MRKLIFSCQLLNCKEITQLTYLDQTGVAQAQGTNRTAQDFTFYSHTDFSSSLQFSDFSIYLQTSDFSIVGCIGEERGEEKRRPYYSEERKVMDKAEVEVMR